MQITNGQSVFLRYLWDKEKTLCEECGGFMAGNTGQDTTSPRDSLLLAHTWVISSRALNEVRAQVPPSHLENLSSPPGIPRGRRAARGEFPPERFEDYTGVYTFPSLTWGSIQYSNNSTKRWDISDDFSLSVGIAHPEGGRRLPRFRSNEESKHNMGAWTFDTGPVLRRQRRGVCEPAEPDSLHRDSFPPLPRHLGPTGFRPTCRTSGACGRT